MFPNKRPWENDKELTNLKNRRRKAKKALMKSVNDDAKTKYNDLCARYAISYRKKNEIYLNIVQKNISKDPTAFWDFVRVKNSNNRLPNKIELDNESANDEKSMANIFAKYFESIYAESVDEEIDFINEINDGTDNDENININSDDVLKILKNLNVKKGRGPDEYPPILYKSCAESISGPIGIIIKQMLNTGQFPGKLKVSYVTPIHKSGSKLLAKNYRSVSVVSPLAKVIELVLIDKRLPKIEAKLSIHQHGFTRKRSTVTNLLVATNDFAKSIVNKSQTDVIYTDFEKAFDRVNHNSIKEDKGFWTWKEINSCYLFISTK